MELLCLGFVAGVLVVAVVILALATLMIWMKGSRP